MQEKINPENLNPEIVKPEAWDDISGGKVKMHKDGNGKEVVEFSEPINTDSEAREAIRKKVKSANRGEGRIEPSFGSSRSSRGHGKYPTRELNQYE